jgi:predicted Fe-Mo cluster-binding NifX family protein
MQTSPMKIVVSSQDFRTVSGHAGQARRWLVFETDTGGAPILKERLELPPPLVFHRFKGPGPHPLDGAAVLITQFSGEGFLAKMRKRGTEVLQTRERDACKAVADYLAGTLAPPPSRRLMSLVCKVRDAFSQHR